MSKCNLALILQKKIKIGILVLKLKISVLLASNMFLKYVL